MRAPIRSDFKVRQQDARIYLAYGSNLNTTQMAFRCPSAVPVGTATIHDHRLAFRGRRQRGVLTIEPCEGKHVPVVAWDISFADELSLDEYEGFPSFYGKEQMTLPVTSFEDGTESMTDAFLYVMTEGRPLGFPQDGYVETVREGYEEFGFDQRLIDEAIAYTKTLQ